MVSSTIRICLCLYILTRDAGAEGFLVYLHSAFRVKIILGTSVFLFSLAFCEFFSEHLDGINAVYEPA